MNLFFYKVESWIWLKLIDWYNSIILHIFLPFKIEFSFKRFFFLVKNTLHKSQMTFISFIFQFSSHFLLCVVHSIIITNVLISRWCFFFLSSIQNFYQWMRWKQKILRFFTIPFNIVKTLKLLFSYCQILEFNFFKYFNALLTTFFYQNPHKTLNYSLGKHAKLKEHRKYKIAFTFLFSLHFRFFVVGFFLVVAENVWLKFEGDFILLMTLKIFSLES